MHLKPSASTLSLSPRPHGPSLLPTHDQVLLIFQGLAQTCLPLCFLSWLSAGLYYWLVCSCCAVLSCSVVSDPYNSVDCSLTGSSVHGILQARILEWVAMPSSRESSQAAVINTRLCGLDHTRWFSHSSGGLKPKMQELGLVSRENSAPGWEAAACSLWPHGASPLGFHRERALVSLPLTWGR